jgi:hypothetical protein
MNKSIFIILLLDIFIISLITTGISFGLYFLGVPLISGFLITFSIIFLIGIVFNYFYKNSILLKNKKIELETVKVLATQTISVNCAYCRAQNDQLIRTDKDIEFNCISCKQPNKIILQYGAVRVTTPLNVG